MTFKTAYGPKLKITVDNPGGSRTKQSHKDECDINKILARFKRTGTLDFVAKHEPQYGDVTGIDFMEAQLIVAKGKGMFHDMPAHLRAEFNNNPAEFLAFINDETNRAKAEKLGLLKPKPPAEEPEKASVASKDAAATPPAPTEPA